MLRRLLQLLFFFANFTPTIMKQLVHFKEMQYVSIIYLLGDRRNIIIWFIDREKRGDI